MWKWVIGYLLTVAVYSAVMISWTSSQITDLSKSGTSITIGGYSGSYMLVNADSKVCVKGISEYDPFEVLTPSGKFISETRIRDYHYGEGCFAPGRWEFIKSSPDLLLTNPDGLSVTSYKPSGEIRTVDNVLILVGAIALLLPFVSEYRNRHSSK